MSIKTQIVSYRDGDTELEGFLAHDEAGAPRKPAVLVCHAWSGQKEFERGKAQDLARLGYAGFAIDVYGRGRRGSSTEENAALMQPFMEDRGMLRRRLLAALQAVSALECADTGRLGAIGFCFGGLCALDLARSGADLRGVVSFHGLLALPEHVERKEIKAKVLVLHGHDDPMVSREQFDAFTREMTEADADWQIHQYGHTVHAFTNPEANDPGFGTVYNAAADRRSWVSMKSFFEEAFS